MNHKLIVFSLSLFCFLNAFAQQDEIYVMSNSRPIDANRYDGIDGTPYFFKTWMSADAYNHDMEKFDSIRVNLNGKTGELEARQQGNFIEVDPKYIAKIVIPAARNTEGYPKGAGEAIVFQQKLHKKFAERWPILIYQGDDFSVIQEFSAIVSTKTFEDVGKTVEKKRFIRKNSYYLLEGGKLSLLKMNKKKLPASLRHSSEMSSYIKKNKTDLKSLADLEKLFAYYDEL